MIKDKYDLFDFLMRVFPSFKSRWESEDNYNLESGGEYTEAGLCAEFSQFFIDSFFDLDVLSVKLLFDEFEDVLFRSESDASVVGLADGIMACFFENIAQTKPGEVSIKLMGRLSRKFFMQWHV
ncbi:hypothetical protein [Chromobacterium vaccinii]|uniref:hypothetical protein n=1 Tax=Chromobacterium vaccinii TaxID=1108595 RepID=UPI000E208DF3|nr:hypothetical protein [Chromobacterium vaccinii]